jgi:hypothetical protein
MILIKLFGLKLHWASQLLVVSLFANTGKYSAMTGVLLSPQTSI